MLLFFFLSLSLLALVLEQRNSKLQEPAGKQTDVFVAHYAIYLSIAMYDCKISLVIL